MAAAIHLSLNDVKNAIQKLLLSNLPEPALVLARQFMPSSTDHVLTTLFQKTVCFEQMSITNGILDLIQNKTLKAVLDASFFTNKQQAENSIRTDRKSSNGTTVADALMSDQTTPAVQQAMQNF